MPPSFKTSQECKHVQFWDFLIQVEFLQRQPTQIRIVSSLSAERLGHNGVQAIMLQSKQYNLKSALLSSLCRCFTFRLMCWQLSFFSFYSSEFSSTTTENISTLHWISSLYSISLQSFQKNTFWSTRYIFSQAKFQRFHYVIRRDSYRSDLQTEITLLW